MGWEVKDLTKVDTFQVKLEDLSSIIVESVLVIDGIPHIETQSLEVPMSWVRFVIVVAIGGSDVVTLVSLVLI